MSSRLSYRSLDAGGLCEIAELIRIGRTLCIGIPDTSITKKTSKKLSTSPVAAKGGTSSRPEVLFTCSSIPPKETRAGLRSSVTEPRTGLWPESIRLVSSVATSSRPLPLSSSASPSLVPSKYTCISEGP